jgi:four helix bundle protein
MPFDALEVSLELIRSLPQAIAGERDPHLHRQIRAAASSVPLNLAEGRRRVGKDRLHHFRIAAGSADELRVALLVALSWGDLEVRDVGMALGLLDRVLAMLWRLTR